MILRVIAASIAILVAFGSLPANGVAITICKKPACCCSRSSTVGGAADLTVIRSENGCCCCTAGNDTCGQITATSSHLIGWAVSPARFQPVAPVSTGAIAIQAPHLRTKPQLWPNGERLILDVGRPPTYLSVMTFLI